MRNLLLAVTALTTAFAGLFAQAADYLTFKAVDGPGKGKRVVLLAGDEEYRSEEAMTLMGQLLAKNGFNTTVCYSVNPDGIVNPDNQKSLSNPSALDSADAIVMSLRFRNWDDSAMEKFEAALNRGVPIVALRTSTHAFNFPGNSKWAKYSFNAGGNTGWSRGFGREVLGETWVSHHGRHKVQGTRTVVEDANKDHPVLTGVGEIFGTTDVYGANPQAPSTVLLRGQVTQSLAPDSPAVEGRQNAPMQPVVWVREYKHKDGTTNRVVTTTMGAATDLLDEDLRRVVANGVFWGLNLPVPTKVDVAVGDDYKPTSYSFKAYKKGMRPADFVIPSIGVEPYVEPAKPAPQSLNLKKDGRIVLMGNGLASRMTHFNHFETETYVRHPELNLVIRNMADEGNTPSFRPHSGRGHQLGFPGAENFYKPYADGNTANGRGHFETEEQWLTRLKPDVLVAFFGFNEAFFGAGNIDNFRAELDAFVKHTKQQTYGNDNPPQLALVSPTAYEDITDVLDVPSGKRENLNLAAYSQVMQEVAAANSIKFIDAFAASKTWYAASKEHLTADGALLNDAGYRALAAFLTDELFGKTPAKAATHRELIHDAVTEKNWFWINDFKIPNGVHVFGQRYKPFGPQNYPHEFKKIREMTDIRDQAIWRATQGQTTDLAALDAKTYELPKVPSNYRPGGKNGNIDFLEGEEALSKLAVPEGYKIEQFATEKEFPNLANPVQMAFDNQGRLWVATMPSYPHYRPGDPRPDDKLIILEDTDNDGKADKETVFADNLHLPMGFEISHDGVYVSQGINLVRLRDTDGDGKADVTDVIYSGFDDHDTHHAIGAFCADPSGAFIMSEGIFLRTNVETPYGTVRGTNGGFYRFAPQTRRLERHAQLHIPNPWGVAFDDWGQHFFLHTSGPTTNWMLPGSVKPRYGVATPNSHDLIEPSHRVRPTAGLEFLISSHFPDDVQGDMLLAAALPRATHMGAGRKRPRLLGERARDEPALSASTSSCAAARPAPPPRARWARRRAPSACRCASAADRAAPPRR